jgi:hypothetical protein
MIQIGILSSRKWLLVTYLKIMTLRSKMRKMRKITKPWTTHSLDTIKPSKPISMTCMTINFSWWPSNSQKKVNSWGMRTTVWMKNLNTCTIA